MTYYTILYYTMLHYTTLYCTMDVRSGLNPPPQGAKWRLRQWRTRCGNSSIMFTISIIMLMMMMIINIIVVVVVVVVVVAALA